MKLQITQGRGAATSFAVTSDGKTVAHLVSDPTNDAMMPVDAATWAQQSGGTVPLEGGKPADTDAQRPPVA